MSDAKVGLSATVWVEVAGLFIVVLDFVNAFGFVPLHVLKPVMRITVSVNMLFGIAARYSRESAPAIQLLRAQHELQTAFLTVLATVLVNIRGGAAAGKNRERG